MLKKIALTMASFASVSMSPIALAHTGAHTHGHEMSVSEWISHAFTSYGHWGITIAVGIAAGLAIIGFASLRHSSEEKSKESK